MSGIKPISVRVYYKKLNNRFYSVKKYQSISEFRQDYFPNDSGKRPLFQIKNYLVINNDIATLFALSQKEIRIILKKQKSRLLRDTKPMNREDHIKLINLDGDTLAIFRNPLIASKLLKIALSTIAYQIDLKVKFHSHDYAFKRLK